MMSKIKKLIMNVSLTIKERVTILLLKRMTKWNPNVKLIVDISEQVISMGSKLYESDKLESIHWIRIEKSKVNPNNITFSFGDFKGYEYLLEEFHNQKNKTEDSLNSTIH